MPGRFGFRGHTVRLGPLSLGPAPAPVDGKVKYYLFEEMDFKRSEFDEYEGIAFDYLDFFESTYHFHLLAGGSRTSPDSSSRVRVSHLWTIPDSNSLEEVMVELVNDDQYAKIDRLVGHTRYEAQDTAVQFGLAHGAKAIEIPPVRPPSGFNYVLGHHQLWTTELNMFSWELDFDAGFYAFAHANPDWVHIGNRLKVTGKIYEVFELWIAPPEDADPEATLAAASWNTKAPWNRTKPDINVLLPIKYDHNRNGKGQGNAKKKR